MMGTYMNSCLKKIYRPAILWMIAVSFFACKKDLPTIAAPGTISGPSAVCYGAQQVQYSVAPASTNDYILWTVPQGAQITSGQGSNTIVVNFGKMAGVVTASLCNNGVQGSPSTLNVSFDCSSNWCRLVDFPGVKRYMAFSFACNGCGYVGGGYGSNSSSNLNSQHDLWKYDPIKLVWTSQASPPSGMAVSDGSGWNASFMINGKYYVMGDNSAFNQDTLYCYDPAANSWTSKSPCPFYDLLYGSACFAVNGKGYVCCGHDVPADQDTNLVWQYDPGLDTWTQMGNFPSWSRHAANGFTINNSGYLYGGEDASGGFNGMWRYNDTTDTWTEIANSPFYNTAHQAFVLNNEAYFVAGYDLTANVFVNYAYSFDPVTKQWGIVPNLPNTVDYTSTFVINQTAYVGTGFFYNSALSLDIFSNKFYSICP